MILSMIHRTVFLLSAVQQAVAQIKVLTPESLVKQFKDTKGHIEGSTATFGAPFYGDRVLGRVVWAPSNGEKHCTHKDYKIPELESTVRGDSGSGALINIVMVRRGYCSFSRKVKIAYEKGAHAVIIVDREDSSLTKDDIHRIIVGDDGYGDKVRIPSILISKEEGAQLIEATKMSEVVVELSWNIPTNHVVEIDLWMSTGSIASQKFMKEFAPKRRVLNEVLRFRPHYVVFGINNTDYNDMCSSSDGHYCAEDPDGSGTVTGKDVLLEDITQLCIHEITKVPRTSLKDLIAGKQLVEYAAKYWDYVEKFGDTCKLTAKDKENRFGAHCSEKLMRSLGIDVGKVTDCILRSKDEKLQYMKENPAWSPRALRINGWRYSGMMSADLVTRAICSGFIKKPDECKTLYKKRDPKVEYVPQRPSGISFGNAVIALLLIGVLMAAALMLYKRSFKARVHSTVREEVMLEVQAQMSSYTKMTADF